MQTSNSEKSEGPTQKKLLRAKNISSLTEYIFRHSLLQSESEYVCITKESAVSRPICAPAKLRGTHAKKSSQPSVDLWELQKVEEKCDLAGRAPEWSIKSPLHIASMRVYSGPITQSLENVPRRSARKEANTYARTHTHTHTHSVL